MDYVAIFEPDQPGFVVTFPAFPEANTGGESMSVALENASDALELVVLTYMKDGRDLPASDTNESDQATRRRIALMMSADARALKLPVPAFAMAKRALISEFRHSGLSIAAFAKLLDKAETEARRMLDPYHATKLASIDQGLRVLGKKLVLTVADLPNIAA